MKSVVQKIRKEQVLTDDAGYEDISIRDERTTTLASAFEPAAAGCPPPCLSLPIPV